MSTPQTNDDLRRDSARTLNLGKISVALPWPRQRQSVSSMVSDTSTAESRSVSLPSVPSITEIYRISTSSTLNLSPTRRPSCHRRSDAVDLRLPPTPDLESPSPASSLEATSYPTPQPKANFEPKTPHSPPCSPVKGDEDYFGLPTALPFQKPQHQEQRTNLQNILQCTSSSLPNDTEPDAQDTTAPPPNAITITIPDQTEQKRQKNFSRPSIPTSASEIKRQAAAAVLTSQGLVIDRSLDSWSSLWDTAYNEKYNPTITIPDHKPSGLSATAVAAAAAAPSRPSTSAITTRSLASKLSISSLKSLKDHKKEQKQSLIAAQESRRAIKSNLDSGKAKAKGKGIIVESHSTSSTSSASDQSSVNTLIKAPSRPSSSLSLRSLASKASFPSMRSAREQAREQRGKNREQIVKHQKGRDDSKELRAAEKSTRRIREGEELERAVEVEFGVRQRLPGKDVRRGRGGGDERKREPFGETVREVARRRREELEYQVSHKCGDGSGGSLPVTPV